MTLNTAPDIPDGLTPTAARIYAALHAAPGITAADLARAASAGQSTTGKLLKQLEHDGLARRIPGGSDGNHRRLPDHWHTSATSPTPGPKTTTLPDQTAAATEPTPTGSSDDAPVIPDSEQHGEQPCPDQTQEATDGGTDEGSGGKATEPEPQNPSPAPSEEPPTGRLGQGGLRNLVYGYLADHPGAAHSPTRIARQLGRSSGAVANALVVLVNQGQAEMVTAKPRTYRATPSGSEQA